LFKVENNSHQLHEIHVYNFDFVITSKYVFEATCSWWWWDFI